MNLVQDIITYIRRIIKAPSNTSISDGLLIDYINRFWIMDVDARIQLFDLKTKYSFLTQPGVDQYNMPLYDIQTESPTNNPQDINFYPVYQGFTSPAYINGISVPLQTEKTPFFNIFPNVPQILQNVETGTGAAGPYNFNIAILGNTQPINPPIVSILRGHVDILGIISTNINIDPPISSAFNTNIPVTSVNPAVYIYATAADGSNIVVTDSGQFLPGNLNYGLLMQPGNAPLGNMALPGGYSTTSNTINYITGEVNVTFPTAIPDGSNIGAQVYFFQPGLPRSILFYNNTLTLRSPPDSQYLVELEAYLSPAAFLNTTSGVPFAYMAEYIARGAARKILSDTGDMEQLQFYEPLFREQEILVWKRSQRQFTNNRTQTIYSQGNGLGYGNTNNGMGSGTL